MKLTKSQLREIIREEIQRLNEKTIPKTGTRDYLPHWIAVDRLKNINKKHFPGKMSPKEAEDILRSRFGYNDDDIKQLKEFDKRPPTVKDADNFIRKVLKIGFKTSILDKWMRDEDLDPKKYSKDFVALVADRIKTKWS